MSFLERQRSALKEFFKQADIAGLFADLFLENGITSMALLKMLTAEDLDTIIDSQREFLSQSLLQQIKEVQASGKYSSKNSGAKNASRVRPRGDSISSGGIGRQRTLSTISSSSVGRDRASSVSSIDSLMEDNMVLARQFPNMTEKYHSRGDVEIFKGTNATQRWKWEDRVSRGRLYLMKDEVSKDYFIIVNERSVHQGMEHANKRNSYNSQYSTLSAPGGSTLFIYPVHGKFELQGKEEEIYMRKFVALETLRSSTHFLGVHFTGTDAQASTGAQQDAYTNSGNNGRQVDSIFARKDAKDFVSALMVCLNINMVDLYQDFCPIKYNIPGGDSTQSVQPWMEPVLKGQGFKLDMIPKVWKKFMLNEVKLEKRTLEDPLEAKKILKVLLDEMNTIEKSRRRLSIHLQDSDELHDLSQQLAISGARRRRQSVSAKSPHQYLGPLSPDSQASEDNPPRNRHVYGESAPLNIQAHRRNYFGGARQYSPTQLDDAPSPNTHTSSSYDTFHHWDEELPDDFDNDDDGTPLPPGSPLTPSTASSANSGGFPTGSNKRSSPIAMANGRARGRSMHEFSSPLVSSPLVVGVQRASRSSSDSHKKIHIGSPPSDHESVGSPSSSSESASVSSSPSIPAGVPTPPQTEGLRYIEKVNQRLRYKAHRKSMSSVLKELTVREVSTLLKKPIEEKAEEFYSNLIRQGLDKESSDEAQDGEDSDEN